MQFKNPNESALALAQKILEENYSSVFLTYINPDANSYCQIVANQLNQPLNLLEKSIVSHSGIPPSHMIILDDGTTRAGEYQEFVDYLRTHFPQSSVIIAIPFIPQSEEAIFKQMADGLITLHVEPLFFSVDQFYQNP